MSLIKDMKIICYFIVVKQTFNYDYYLQFLIMLNFFFFFLVLCNFGSQAPQVYKNKYGVL